MFFEGCRQATVQEVSNACQLELSDWLEPIKKANVLELVVLYFEPVVTQPNLDILGPIVRVVELASDEPLLQKLDRSLVVVVNGRLELSFGEEIGVGLEHILRGLLASLLLRQKVVFAEHAVVQNHAYVLVCARGALLF